jgi:hypothetical protein
LLLAFVVLTIVAFLAILVAGRYPRSMFDFQRRRLAMGM